MESPKPPNRGSYRPGPALYTNDNSLPPHEAVRDHCLYAIQQCKEIFREDGFYVDTWASTNENGVQEFHAAMRTDPEDGIEIEGNVSITGAFIVWMRSSPKNNLFDAVKQLCDYTVFVKRAIITRRERGRYFCQYDWAFETFLSENWKLENVRAREACDGWTVLQDGRAEKVKRVTQEETRIRTNM